LKKKTSLDHKTFRRLSIVYRVALSAVALSILLSQFLIQRFLNNQVSDSHIVNIAGRQRMLSQKLTKEVLQLSPTDWESDRTALLTKIKGSTQLWKSSHHSLQYGNDSLKVTTMTTSTISKMFRELDPYYEYVYRSATRIINAIDKNPNIAFEHLKKDIDTIITYEPFFLQKMDAIVSTYATAAKEKVNGLKKLEYFILIITLLLLVLELLFLFRPIANRVRKTINEVLQSEETAKKMAINADNIRQSREASVQELLALNYAMDQTVLFARIQTDGTIVTIGERFARFLGYEHRTALPQKLSELLRLNDTETFRFQNYIEQQKGPIVNKEFETENQNGANHWLDISILPVLQDKGVAELLVLCNEITSRKEAQYEIERLTASQYKEREQLQKSRASQVVEAQEEERKRIAREIHDSIGQMLTALKFNIESLNINNPQKTAQKIEGLKKLTKDLIRGVRMATFNLTPPELMDYGIGTALQKMARELSKLTSKKILFENKSNFDLRLDTLVETNLYRVTQEAVNNTIKYADADYILITINHSTTVLSIHIQDNGKGFDTSKVPENPSSDAEGGMGLFFMKERMTYINGKIFINSIPGEGTRVTLNYGF